MDAKSVKPSLYSLLSSRSVICNIFFVKMPKLIQAMSLKNIAFEEILSKLRKFGNFDQCFSNLQYLRKFLPNMMHCLYCSPKSYLNCCLKKYSINHFGRISIATLRKRVPRSQVWKRRIFFQPRHSQFSPLKRRRIVDLQGIRIITSSVLKMFSM